MNDADLKLVPAELWKNDSVLLHLASAYLSVMRQMERKTGCSQTRGFVLSTLRGGASLNQNQIAKILGYDRTVVHRTIRNLVREGLVSERKAKAGPALLVQLTAKGTRYRETLIEHRRTADEKLRKMLSTAELAMLTQTLRKIAELEL